MTVNIGSRVAPVNIAFSSSRNAVLIERKVLQYTTLSIKLHHFTLSEKNNTQIRTFYWNLILLRFKRVLTYQMSTCRRTIQAQSWKFMFFVVCINKIMKVIHCFSLHLFSLTNFFEIKSIFLQSIRSKQYPQAQQKLIDCSCGFSFQG